MALISAPSIRSDAAANLTKLSWPLIGLDNAFQIGKPGIKLSGNTINSAPAWEASVKNLIAF